MIACDEYAHEPEMSVHTQFTDMGAESSAPRRLWVGVFWRIAHG
jgi:hypothetical protein